MFLPIGTDRPRTKRARVTLAVIIGLVAIHLVVMVLERTNPSAYEAMLNALAVRRGNWMPWTFFTSSLLHADLWHLGGNCLFLWVFGPNVEDRFGHARFAGFLALGALASALGHVAATPNPAIGFSGAVSAATGAYFVLFPRTRIRTFIFFFVITTAMIPAWVFIGFSVARDMFGWLMPGESGIAHVAHLAGYALGAGVSALALKVGWLEPEVYDLVYTFKQRRRRAQLRAAAAGVSPERMSRDAKPPRRDPVAERAGAARSEIAHLVAGQDLDAAANVLRAAINDLPEVPSEPVLQALTPGRTATLRLAEHCVRSHKPREAAWLYERFVRTYPRDPETPSARLFAALLLARDLDRADAARGLLGPHAAEYQGEEAELARSILETAQGSKP